MENPHADTPAAKHAGAVLRKARGSARRGSGALTFRSTSRGTGDPAIAPDAQRG
jgi:hypothetical protein